MVGGGKKESERANDLARQERMRAEEQAAQLRAQQEAAAAQLMAEIQGVVAPTGQERSTQQQLAGLQPDVEAMLRQSAQGGSPVNTPLALALQERLLGDMNRNPDDVFAPNLELLKGQVGQFAARRGIVGSGLELEQLGRTGVELAIQQAMSREQLRADSVNRAMQGNQSLETIGAQRRGELSGFLQNLQSLEDARRAREVGAVSGGAQQGARIRSQGNLTALERLNQGDARAGQYESDQLAYDRSSRAAQQAAIGKLIGTVAGVGTSFIPGVGPALAPLVLAGMNGNALSMPQQPVSTTKPGVSQLLAASRKPSSSRGGYNDFYDSLTSLGGIG